MNNANNTYGLLSYKCNVLFAAILLCNIATAALTDLTRLHRLSPIAIKTYVTTSVSILLRDHDRIYTCFATTISDLEIPSPATHSERKKQSLIHVDRKCGNTHMFLSSNYLIRELLREWKLTNEQTIHQSECALQEVKASFSYMRA